MKYLKSDEKLSDFPEKYNKHVKVTRMLIYLVFILVLVVIWLTLREDTDNIFQWQEIFIGIVVVGVGHIIVKKIIDPSLIANTETNK